MKLAIRAIWALLLTTFLLDTASAQLVPPQQDYYLHLVQIPNYSVGGDALARGEHEVAWTWGTGGWPITDAITVESWVLWEPSDLEEIQTATGLDIDRMTLFCGLRAFGFQYRSYGAEGWTFFLQTDSGIYPDTGNIPLPLGEWAHLAATYDGATIRTYLNGVQQTETVASGIIPADDRGDAFPEHCNYGPVPDPSDPSEFFGVGVGMGFTGGLRQLRVWNRALTEGEILSNAGIHLDGTEAGLLEYWPLNGPPEMQEAVNEVPDGRVLNMTFSHRWQMPRWLQTDPLFVTREDLAEDILVTDCPSLGMDSTGLSFSLVDIHDDGDQDVLFSGISGEWNDGYCLEGLVPYRSLIRDGANGFVFDTAAAIAGTAPIPRNSFRTVTKDFNGDGRLDIFSANTGGDGCDPFGDANTLLLSSPDGRLEDASDNLLGAPCNADTPAFAGQHHCFGGSDEFGRTPGVRYPGTGEAVVPPPDFTHGVAAGDTDSDGDVDILVGNPTHDLELSYLLINDGNGNFLADWQLLPDQVYSIFSQGGMPLNPGGFLLEDFDGDGHVDLVSAPLRSLWEPVWLGGIHWNDGTGDFSTADTLIIEPTAGIPDDSNGYPGTGGFMLAFDIDEDGDKDLLVTWIAEGSTSLQILVNQGGRVFDDQTVARVGIPPQVGMPEQNLKDFHAEDVNMDGCPDLLFAKEGSDVQIVRMFLNNCLGYFEAPAETVVSKNGVSFPLDFDGDGDIDLINANKKFVALAGTEACLPDAELGTDYIDFAVLLNTTDLPDTDGDGVADIYDVFSNDPNEWFDADDDGIGDNADLDDDNDQMPDTWETANGLNLRDATDAYLDGDGDSYININEFLAGTDPRKADSAAGIFLDLVSLGNVDGNNRTDLGVLLRDLDSDKNKLYVMDGGSGNNFRTLSFGTEQYQAATSVTDSTGDQVPEFGVLVNGSLFSRVKDVVNNTLLGKPKFNANYEPIAFLSVGEAGGSAGPDVVMVGREEATGKVRAWVKEVASGSLVRLLTFSKAFVPFAAVAVDNVGDTNAMEIAVLGIDATGKVQATVKDAQSGTLIAKIKFNKLFTPLYFAAVPDANGDLTNLAVLGRNASGVIQAQIKRVSDGALVSSIRFSKGYDPRAFISFADSNGSGSGELGVVGVNDSGAVRAQVKEIADGTAVKNINFSKSYPPLDAIAINGAAGTDRNEIAVLGRDVNGQYRLQIMDLLTGNLAKKISVP